MQNPIDTPVGVMQAQGGRAFGQILNIVAEASEMDWLVVHISIQNLFSFLGDPETALQGSVAGFLDVADRVRGRMRAALVLRTNGDPALDPIRAGYREQAVALRAGVQQPRRGRRRHRRLRPMGRAPPPHHHRRGEDMKKVPFGLSTGVFPYGFPGGRWFGRLWGQMEAWGFEDVAAPELAQRESGVDSATIVEVGVQSHERARPGELLHLDVKKLGGVARVDTRITGDRRSRAWHQLGTRARGR